MEGNGVTRGGKATPGGVQLRSERGERRGVVEEGGAPCLTGSGTGKTREAWQLRPPPPCLPWAPMRTSPSIPGTRPGTDTPVTLSGNLAPGTPDCHACNFQGFFQGLREATWVGFPGMCIASSRLRPKTLTQSHPNRSSNPKEDPPYPRAPAEGEPGLPLAPSGHSMGLLPNPLPLALPLPLPVFSSSSSLLSFFLPRRGMRPSR